MKDTLLAGALAAAVAASAAVAAFAHGGATGVVADRMNGMMKMSEQIKLLNPMLSGEKPRDTAQMQAAGKTIARHAGETMLASFPKGSIEGPSEARPAIWQEWDRFAGLARKLSKLGAELARSAATWDGTPAAAREPDQDEPELSEWEKLDAGVLLGTKSRKQRENELATRRNAKAETEAPKIRRPKAVFSEIAATCSGCHADYRR